MATLSTRPAFTHDCQCGKCVFVCHVAEKAGASFDLYEGCDGSLIARTGSEGPEYHAMPREMAAHLADGRGVMGRAFAVWGALRGLDAALA